VFQARQPCRPDSAVRLDLNQFLNQELIKPSRTTALRLMDGVPCIYQTVNARYRALTVRPAWLPRRRLRGGVVVP
jgi:hypothetical protein